MHIKTVIVRYIDSQTHTGQKVLPNEKHRKRSEIHSTKPSSTSHRVSTKKAFSPLFSGIWRDVYAASDASMLYFFFCSVHYGTVQAKQSLLRLLSLASVISCGVSLSTSCFSIITAIFEIHSVKVLGQTTHKTQKGQHVPKKDARKAFYSFLCSHASVE